MENELEIVKDHMRDQPVNVAAIFADLGVDYVEDSILSGESGWIECQDGKFKVVVNADEGPQRRRFTAAHELAHYLMHRDLLCRAGKLNRHTDRLFGNAAAHNREAPFQHRHEVQANKLAAQIIMPASSIAEAWDGVAGKPELFRVSALAQKFDVSKAAMSIRLKTLGLVND